MAEDGATVSSRQYQRYEFDARASAPYTLDDRLFTVSMHLNVSRVRGEKFKGRCAGNVIVSLRLSSASYLVRLGPVYPTNAAAAAVKLLIGPLKAKPKTQPTDNKHFDWCTLCRCSRFFKKSSLASKALAISLKSKLRLLLRNRRWPVRSIRGTRLRKKRIASD